MRLLAFLPRCSLVLLLVAGLCLGAAPASHAGEYAVTACFGAENASWTPWTPTPGAVAYSECPGGVIDVARPRTGEGMIARNVAGPGLAARGTTAALNFDAPAGTVITGVDFDAKLLTNPGWSAGVYDATRGAWLWCGAHCGTTVGQWFHKELRGLSTQRLQALVRCDGKPCRRDVRRGFVALRNARVHLADASAPRLGGLRGPLGVASGWLRGVHDVAYDAADNTGILAGRVELDGRGLLDDPRACDFTRRVPCSDATTAASFDTRTWSEGAHALRFGAKDAAGNWTWISRTVRIDNTAPPEPVPALEGGAGWSPHRARTLTVPLPGDQAAPLVRARVKACRAGGACTEAAPELATASGGATAAVPVTAFDGPGEYAIRLALEDAAGNVGPYAPPLTMRFDDVRPGAPDVSAADRWHDGGALPLAAEGEPPVSGIHGFRVRFGGRETTVATSFALDELPEGGTPAEFRAVSGSGVESTAVRTTLKLDRSRPVVTAVGVPAPDAWAREPVRIALRGRDQPGLSGVQSLVWALDGGEEAVIPGDETTLEVAADGRHTVTWRAVDGAGNGSERHTAAVKVDRTPPETVAFEAADPADPALVRVVVADATSGVAGGRVELRRAGGDWRRVATSLEGGRLLTRLDDASLRAGRYELRAVVTDAAGNETVGTRRTDGAPAALALPLRRRVSLTARRSGRTLRARLTSAGRPLALRPLTLSQRLRGQARWRPACPRLTVAVAATGSGGCGALRTDAAGRLELRIARGPSRTLRLAFDGDRLLLPARAQATVRTRARGWVLAHPRSIPAGGTVRFAGHLRGGHIPPSGKLVELQARVGAAWRTFATVRTDRRGDLRHVHNFGATSGGRTYWIRLRIRREAAYPFSSGISRPIAVRVT